MDRESLRYQDCNPGIEELFFQMGFPTPSGIKEPRRNLNQTELLMGTFADSGTKDGISILHTKYAYEIRARALFGECFLTKFVTDCCHQSEAKLFFL